MIDFLFERRDPAQVALPPSGMVRPFADLDGNLCLLDDQGTVIVLAAVTDADPGAGAIGAERLGGIIDGATLGAKNRVGRTVPGGADAPGFRGLPSNPRSAGYTLALTDAGISVPNTAGGWAIPDNAAVPFPIDTTIVLRNDSDAAQALTIGTDTLRWAGTTNTGARTVAARGVATVCKTRETEWLAWGHLS